MVCPTYEARPGHWRIRVPGLARGPPAGRARASRCARWCGPAADSRTGRSKTVTGDLRDAASARARRRRLRPGLSRGRRLPAVGGRSERDCTAPTSMARAMCCEAARAGRRGARGLHQHGGLHRHPAGRRGRRRSPGVARGHGGRITSAPSFWPSRWRWNSPRRAAGGDRESHGAHRAITMSSPRRPARSCWIF